MDFLAGNAARYAMNESAACFWYRCIAGFASERRRPTWLWTSAGDLRLKNQLMLLLSYIDLIGHCCS